MNDSPQPADLPATGFLAAVERLGNRLPEPAMLFVWLIGVLIFISVMAQGLGWSASLPFSGTEPPPFGTLEGGRVVFRAQSLLDEENVARFFVDMPRTLTGFAPLGFVLVIMFGASVAERSGFFAALIRQSLAGVPLPFLTPVITVIGMVAHHASDSVFVVYVPLVGLLYAMVGRHPLAGLVAGFAAVSGGFAGNLAPSQLDVLLLSFTQEAARIVAPGWLMNPFGYWYYIVAVVILFTPIVWFLTDRVIEPRLGRWDGRADADLAGDIARAQVTPLERRGLAFAAVAAVAVALLAIALLWWPGFTPLTNEGEGGFARYQPFFNSLIALFATLFLATGVAFGIGAGTVRDSRDVITMMTEGIRSMAPYIVFAFFAANFIAMFSWSRLGPITAINGAAALAALGLPAPLLLVGVLLLSSILDLFIGSATAKWSALAPVVVPMFMLLGISPEMTTAAYRMGDSYTNILTPLNPYVMLCLGFARRYVPSLGLGSLLALFLPYALAFMTAGIAMTAAWVALDLPLGPGTQVSWVRPMASPAP
jgi:aminobenzoyl-glutamate transport protein